MDFAEAKQWLETLGVTSGLTEETWNRMDEATRIIFMADARIASGQKVEFVIVSPCGHPLRSAKNTGTPSWQTRWTCGECGKNFSR